MAENRTPRELETRQQSERPKQWMPAELLPEPDKQPGFSYRWIRVSMLNNADPRNLSQKIREGWEPVRAEDYPELMFTPTTNPATTRFKDNVEIGGLVLCKAPEELMKQRAAFYAKQTQAQAEAVDNNLMRQNDARMPVFNDKRSTVSFGRGNKS